MDSQVIELLGRNRLVSELLRAGLEVAIPARDRGIDLIAYLDLIDPPDRDKLAEVGAEKIHDKPFQPVEEIEIVSRAANATPDAVFEEGCRGIAPHTPLQRFIAKPIQMKAASRQVFSISRKYDKLRDLIIAFVWNLEDPAQAVTYALTYAEAVAVGDALGWTKTPSWLEGHKYDNTRPGAKVVEMLEPFRMTSAQWLAKISGVPDRASRFLVGDDEITIVSRAAKSAESPKRLRREE